MDLPNYTDLGKIYEMNPGAFMEAQNQMGLARQFQDQKLLQERHTTRKQELANIFDEQNNPIRLQQGQLENEGLGLKNRGLGVDTRIKEATEGLQLDATQKALIQKAKQSDLDMMEIQGQQWAYSQHPDPRVRERERAQGEQLLRMHKDFIKLRDTQKFTADEAAKQRSHAFALEAQRAKNAQALVTSKAAAKASADSGVKNVFEAVQSGKVSPDKAAAAFGAAALQAEAQGDVEQASVYRNAAAQMEQLSITTKPDMRAGKADLAGAGIATTPPRAPTFTPGPAPVPKPAQAPTASFAEVQKQYPGVPADKLREAYKRKFGVDLK